MKHYRLLNSDDGMIVEQVDGKNCTYCNSAFIYKDDKVYHLIDIDSGQSICKSYKLKRLEELYKERKKQYEDFKKTDTYKIKVERFEKMKLVEQYSKGVK